MYGAFLRAALHGVAGALLGAVMQFILAPFLGMMVKGEVLHRSFQAISDHGVLLFIFAALIMFGARTVTESRLGA